MRNLCFLQKCHLNAVFGEEYCKLVINKYLMFTISQLVKC